MVRHKWAPALLESRTAINPAALRYIHGLLEVFRAGGISYDLAHALHALKQSLLYPGVVRAGTGGDDEEVSKVDGENGHRTPASRRDDG